VNRIFLLILLILSSTLLAGCASDMWSQTSSPFNKLDPIVSGQPAGELLAQASQAGSLTPITWVAGLFLLCSIPAFFLLSKKHFIQLLLVGVCLAILPIVLLAVVEHLVVPAAIMAGLLGVGGVLFFLGRLWDRYLMKKKCKNIAESVLSADYPKRLKDGDVADLVLSLTSKESK
jgi:hypothetical protein